MNSVDASFARSRVKVFQRSVESDVEFGESDMAVHPGSFATSA